MSKSMKVRATKVGRYLQNREPGEEFMIDDAALFSKSWMEEIPSTLKKPEPKPKLKAAPKAKPKAS